MGGMGMHLGRVRQMPDQRARRGTLRRAVLVFKPYWRRTAVVVLAILHVILYLLLITILLQPHQMLVFLHHHQIILTIHQQLHHHLIPIPLPQVVTSVLQKNGYNK